MGNCDNFSHQFCDRRFHYLNDDMNKKPATEEIAEEKVATKHKKHFFSFPESQVDASML